jgi:ribosomal protein S25
MTTSREREQVEGLIATLSTALDNVKSQRAQFDNRVEEIWNAFDVREQSLLASMENIRRGFGLAAGDASTDVVPSERTQESTDEQRRLSISQEPLEKVANMLKQHGSLRQADVTKQTGLNSGTVSVALRVLQEQGRVHPGEKHRGSRMWIHNAPVLSDEPHEVVIRPGEGVLSGQP